MRFAFSVFFAGLPIAAISLALFLLTPEARALPRSPAPLSPAQSSSASPSAAPPPSPATSAGAPVDPPKLLSSADVGYPDGGKGDAEVVLTLTINADGTVQSASAAETNEPFSSQAVGAALGWTFEPARRNGVAISAKIRFQLTFHQPPPDPNAPSEPSPYGPEPSGDEPTKAPEKPKPVTEVVIHGERVEPSRTATLSRAEVRQIPGTFGDPFRAIEVMPGVTPVVSGLPFFFIRGAPPGDVGYFLDGIRVPLLFHVGAGPSVVNPGLVDRVDLYPGGYPARFGRFSGGIVTGETTAPLPKLHGEYNLRLFDVGALAEAPFAGERGTVLVGGRYSYTATLVSLLASGVQLDYWDYQIRSTFDLTPVDRIGVFIFGSYDYLGQVTPTETITVFGTEFHRVDARYDHFLPNGGSIRLAATAGLDRTRLPGDRFVRSRLLGLRNEIIYRASPAVLLRAGSDVEMSAYDVELNTALLDPAVVSGAGLFPTRTDLTVGSRIDAVLTLRPGFEVTPGIRLDFFSSQGATALAVDPRLATRLELSSRMRLLSALGVAHQTPAFAVPVPGFQPGGIRGGLQQALQESTGLEMDVDATTTATATLFHNAFFDMSDPLNYQPPQLNGCPAGFFPENSIGSDRGNQVTGNQSCLPRWLPYGTLGRDGGGGGGAAAVTALETRTMGTAYGLELFLKRKLTSRIGGTFSYTLSHSIRSVGRNRFVADFDRTHVVTGTLAYGLGRNWRAGTRVTYYTGLPRAPDPTDASTRLPAFFRIDVRLEKRWQLGEKTWISFVAEWMNATLSKESVGTNCNLQGCTPQEIGPVTIPSLGLEGGF